MDDNAVGVSFETFRLETLDFLSAMKSANELTLGFSTKQAGFKDVCKKYDMGGTLTFTDTF